MLRQGATTRLSAKEVHAALASQPRWSSLPASAVKRACSNANHHEQRALRLWREQRHEERRDQLLGNRTTTVAVSARGRQLASATEADWRNRMVFYPGDERDFYRGQSGIACEASSALYDPACRTPRKRVIPA